MRRKSLSVCLFTALFLGGCYVAAWDRDKLDYWSGQELPGKYLEALPDLESRDEIQVLVFGDSGKPSTFETVAGWMSRECSGRCDFALMLGDNFYRRGPGKMDREEFAVHFSEPIKGHEGHLEEIPFWVILGNHGYVKQFGRPPSEPSVQLEYTRMQAVDERPLWLMPSHEYAVPKLPAWLTLVGFDSMFLSDRRSFNGSDDDYDVARRRYAGQIKESITAKDSDGWRVLFGHHPHISIGSHADDSQMHELPEPLDETMPVIYFSGHDHDQQLIEVGELIQVVQGVASKTRARKWGGEKAEKFFKENLAPAYAARNETVSAEYCEKLGFAIATFREREFEITFFWGESGGTSPSGQQSWSWRRDGSGQVSRTNGGPSGSFTDLCPK